MNKLVFLLLVLLPLYTSAVGGWSPISNIKDPHVVEIGQFAVTEYNKQNKSKLKFEMVVRGETQVVEGTNYRLTLTAKEDGGRSNNYIATVWEKPSGFRSLTSFKPSN